MSLMPNIYMCRQCGYLYDVDKGEPSLSIPPKTPLDAFPESWKCPECGSRIDCLEEIL